MFVIAAQWYAKEGKQDEVARLARLMIPLMLGGIALGTFGAIILYQIFQHAPVRGASEGPAEAAKGAEPLCRGHLTVRFWGGDD
jgi:hypothetical protein